MTTLQFVLVVFGPPLALGLILYGLNALWAWLLHE